MMGWACLRQTSTAVNDEDEDSHGSGPADQQLAPHAAITSATCCTSAVRHSLLRIFTLFTIIEEIALQSELEHCAGTVMSTMQLLPTRFFYPWCFSGARCSSTAIKQSR